MRTKWIAAVAAAAVVGSVAVVLVQSGGQTPAERTLTGCVRVGSAPAVFVLRGANSPASPESADHADGQQLPEDYLLVSIPPAVSLEALVNHRVAITGMVSDAAAGPPPPAGANAAEKAIQRIAVKGVKEIAQNCAAR
jgi:hypothetical protein